ncbi:hypothetical protein [Streptomyces sp. NPDC048419]|uniref:hypothetical protein n=1 Tax=Streptomyces sp. NPDC048419 TaxID=3365547 RepID=UPI0037115895
MFYEDETTADALQADHEAKVDTDLQQAEMESAARRSEAHEKAGYCAHLSAVGYLPAPVYEEQRGLQPDQLRCTGGCATVFESDEAWYAALNAPELNPVKRTGRRGATPLRQADSAKPSGGA